MRLRTRIRVKILRLITFVCSTQPAGLGIYVQHNEAPIPYQNHEKWRAEMRSYIGGEDDPTNNHWVFGPMSLDCKLSVDTSPSTTPVSSRIWHGVEMPQIAEWVR